MSSQLGMHPYKYDFFQAVRLLERSAALAHGAESPRRVVGEDAAPQHEVVRFRAYASLTFSSSAIHHLQHARSSDPDARGSGPPEMTVNFMGLTGPAGVLPQHYTTLLLSRLRQKDHALREFLDLFNHRQISHFYRAWKKYHFPIPYEQTDGGRQGTDAFTQALYSLIGLGTEGVRNRSQISDQTPVYYGGLFAQQARSALSLERMLTEHLGQPVRVKQFRGSWLQLDRSIQTRLTERGVVEEQYNQLGQTVVLGERVWDVQGKFRLVIGPLNYNAFERYMPCGDDLQPLCELTRRFVGAELAFEVQVLLKAPEVPECRLGSSIGVGSRLGCNTWLRSRPATRDASDAVFSLETI